MEGKKRGRSVEEGCDGLKCRRKGRGAHKTSAEQSQRNPPPQNATVHGDRRDCIRFGVHCLSDGPCSFLD